MPEVEGEEKRAGQLERELESSREETESLRREKENMEQNVSTHRGNRGDGAEVVCCKLNMSCVWCVQLEDRIAELQAGIAAALQGQREAQQRTSDHKLQLDSLRDSQTSLQVSVREERERREREERIGCLYG